MKTRSFLLSGLVILGLIIFPALVNAETSTFQKAFKKSVKYPAFASEKGAEGTVWVEIDVLPDGSMKVLESNHSCCPEMRDKVIKQLDGKKLKDYTPDMKGKHHIKIVFEIRED